MLKFIVCDDNIEVMNKLSNMLESIFLKNDLEAEIVLKTNTGEEILEFAKENLIDVLVLDINLNSKRNGIDIANKVREINKDCYIIFTTAHSEYVFLAYQCKTFDYLCKPITKERFELTILRLIEDISGNSKKIKYIKLDSKNTLINANEIQYIKRDGMKLIFHTSSKDYEVYSSFAKIQNQLPNNFIRCHKSFIANISNISKLEPTGNLIYFKNNATCDIGPKYKTEFMKGVSLHGNIE